MASRTLRASGLGPAGSTFPVSLLVPIMKKNILATITAENIEWNQNACFEKDGSSQKSRILVLGVLFKLYLSPEYDLRLVVKPDRTSSEPSNAVEPAPLSASMLTFVFAITLLTVLKCIFHGAHF